LKHTLRTLATIVWLGGTILLAQNGAYHTGFGVSAPRKISGPEPEYTDKARQEKLQGTVTLRLIITPAGTTRDIKVEKSLDPGLDQKAIEAVSQWKFAPAMKDGHPVGALINIQVAFKLY
jgi:protein TonB